MRYQSKFVPVREIGKNIDLSASESLKYSEYNLDGRRNFPLKKTEIKRTTYFGNWGIGDSMSKEMPAYKLLAKCWKKTGNR